MRHAKTLKTRQPWWLRHLAALVAAGGIAIVVTFSLNVWTRLMGAYGVATARAYGSLDSLGHASAMALTPVLEAAELAARQGAIHEGEGVDEPEPHFHLLRESELRQDVAVSGLLSIDSPTVYLRAGSAAEGPALAFVKPLMRDGARWFLAIDLPELWLRARMKDLLGDQRAVVQILDAEGTSVAWVSANELSVDRREVTGGSVPLDRTGPRAPSFSAEKDRWLAGEAIALRGSWGALRVVSAEGDVLEQYYGRWTASVWLVPLVSVLVMAIAILSGLALRRLQRSEAALHRQATTDALTGLPNRVTFTTLLETEVKTALASQQPLGLLFIDLDNFKYVNDSLGHDGGDQLLQVVAQRLCEGVREADTVCRMGGDEFVIVLSELAASEDAMTAAYRVLQCLTRPLQVKGTTLVPQASIGVAVLGEDAHDSGELTRAADMAVYEAKAAGKSCAVRFTPQLARETAQIAQVVQDLQLGIDRGELFVEFQPKYVLSSGALAGFEALVRWQHPTRGLIMPSQFIEIAESSGLIGAVGNCVMEQAVAQLRSWYDASLGWQVVAINVSAIQLRDKVAVHLLKDLLARYQVPGSCIQVELTESALVNDVDNAISAIAEFKAMGASLAVDDFGTGYSSLQSLQRFKVDYLKVDRSFVQGALKEAGSLEICRAIVKLGHSLGMRIIAEGIETAEQRTCMQSLGCEQGQGYLLDRPLSAETATLRLTLHARQMPQQLQSSLELWVDNRLVA